MTDEAFAYHEDVATRSKQKNSAYHKKNGSAVTKLGNKPMSWQEIQKNHGPVETYDLQRFMSFSEFKEMPKDLQIEYLNKLQDKYDIGIKHISLHLFNIGEEGLQSHLRINKILDKCNPDKRRAKTGLNLFKDDIAEAKRRAKYVEVIDFQEKQERIAKLPLFMTYDDMKKLNVDEAVIFVNRLIEKYGVGYSAVASDLLEIAPATLTSWFKTRKALDCIPRGTKGGNQVTAMKNAKKFREDVKAWKKGQNVEMPEEPVCDISEQVPKEVIEETLEKHPIPEPVVKEISEISQVDKIEETTVEKRYGLAEQIEFHDSSYISNYVRVGLDMSELHALGLLFEGKKVHVDIRITEM